MSEQLALVPVPPSARRRAVRAPASDRPLAERAPVARVLVDTPLAHLDRPFEYSVPADLDEVAQPGVRVRVRFAGRDHDGILLARFDQAEHAGRLTPLRTVVSPEPVLTAPVAEELRLVADHYGGTAADVLRLALPPRHARAERSVPTAGAGPDRAPAAEEAGPAATGRTSTPWDAYPAGPALLRRIADGQAPGASWLALPCQEPEHDWPAAVTDAVRAAGESGRGSLVVLPDRRDVDRLHRTLTQELGEEQVARLTADLGPEARYREFLRVLRGHARVVVGTRSAAFAPVRDLGLLVCWDEADDLHQEPRAPYPHVREVLRLRARHESAALLLGGFTRSVPVQAWVRSGAVAPVAGSREVLRAAAPRVLVAGEGWAQERDGAAATARIPSQAWTLLKEGLEHGPVLVQVPRQGYVVGLACQDCRTPVRCPHCHGPVGAGAGPVAPRCRWCARAVPEGHACGACGSLRRRATAVGERRTAEELGRAFPGTRVISSGGDRVVEEVGGERALVVATPGAEPFCPTGYAAVALLDGWRLLERPALEAQPEALRRWAAAVTLARSREGARSPLAVLCGVPPHGRVPAVEALVRWDPGWLAARELAERVELGLPPARRHISVSGPPAAVQEAADALRSQGLELLGVSRPVAPPQGGSPAPGQDQAGRTAPRGRARRDEQPRAVATLREPDDRPGAAAPLVHALRAARSARKAGDVLRLTVGGDDVGG